MPDENGVVQFKDFTSHITSVRFKVGENLFDALPVIPLATAEELSKLGEDIKQGSTTERINKISTLFSALLTEESAARFQVMAQDPKGPLGIKQVQEIIMWLLEVHGLRPTQALSESSSGSDETSTPSTDGAPETE